MGQQLFPSRKMIPNNSPLASGVEQLTAEDTPLEERLSIADALAQREEYALLARAATATTNHNIRRYVCGLLGLGGAKWPRDVARSLIPLLQSQDAEVRRAIGAGFVAYAYSSRDATTVRMALAVAYPAEAKRLKVTLEWLR